MTLMDYFAGQALACMTGFHCEPYKAAKFAFDIADAMIQEKRRRELI